MRQEVFIGVERRRRWFDDQKLAIIKEVGLDGATVADVNGRTLRHAGYAISQRCRKRIEEIFGWVKAQAGLWQVKVRGRKKAEAVFIFAIAAYNLVRLPKLLATAT